jgi:hypothetical protein
MTARIDLNGARTQQERTLTILETRLDSPPDTVRSSEDLAMVVAELENRE